MYISILPKYNKITIDDISIECQYTVPANIESAFYDDVKKRGKIQYNDGTDNKLLTKMPNLSNLLIAYWDAYSIKFLPSKYHSWNAENKEFFISSTNQVLKDSDDTAAQAAHLLIETEIVAHPLMNITRKEAAQWIDDNVTDLASAKTALKHIVNLILLRT